MKGHIIDRYDSVLYTSAMKEYTGDSGFANFGFWDENTTNSKQASYNLLEKLQAFIPERAVETFNERVVRRFSRP